MLFVVDFGLLSNVCAHPLVPTHLRRIMALPSQACVIDGGRVRQQGQLASQMVLDLDLAAYISLFLPSQACALPALTLSRNQHITGAACLAGPL